MKRTIFYQLLSLALILMAGMTTVAHGQDFNGTWSGVIDVDQPLTIVFNIQQTSDGVNITWDSPDQGVFGLPATATISGNELNVDMPISPRATYKGILEGEALNGTFTQGGYGFTLNMSRTVTNWKSTEQYPSPGNRHRERYP